MSPVEDALEEALRASRGIAMFPLPGITLFPRQLLPLHVFEPRYREMMSDVIEAQQLVVMGRLQPGYQSTYEGRPPVFPIAGLGRMRDHQELPDGRSLLVLEGIHRVQIVEECSPKERYRRVRVTLLEEERALLTSAQRAKLAALVSRCETLTKAMGAKESLSHHLSCHPDLHDQLDILSATLAPGPSSRQKLLETIDPGVRIDELQTIVDRLLQGLN